MLEIIKDDVLLARVIYKKDIKEGLSFFSDEKEYIQVGTWNYDSNKVLERHYHNILNRKISKTFEVIVVLQGSALADIYDSNNILVKSIKLNEGDTLIQLNSGHGYRILEDNTKVIEIKNGPYLGPDLDRTRF